MPSWTTHCWDRAEDLWPGNQLRKETATAPDHTSASGSTDLKQISSTAASGSSRQHSMQHNSRQHSGQITHQQAARHRMRTRLQPFSTQHVVPFLPASPTAACLALAAAASALLVVRSFCWCSSCTFLRASAESRFCWCSFVYTQWARHDEMAKWRVVA